jgi:tRNA (mo5U34)-methyltransferase
MAVRATTWLRDALGGGRRARSARLRDEILRLGPWSQDVEVAPGLTTAVSREAPEAGDSTPLGNLTIRRDHDRFVGMLKDVYPDGLAGRRVLDCACNCGVYVFWASEVGAGASFGFDVREHWIDQARFLARERWPEADSEFEVRDLYDLPDRGLDPFDITVFKSIFYHLPDPVTGLRIAADLTRELLILNTAVVDGREGALIVNPESDVELLSGVHRLAWLPTGPGVLRHILEWCGFPHTRLSLQLPPLDGNRARIELLAARDEGVFCHYDEVAARR